MAMGRGKYLLIACGALARELVHLKKLNRWHDLDIQCLPAELHNRPQEISPAIADLLDKLQAQYERCFVAYADCGSGGRLDALLRKYGVERLPGAHCYEFYAGTQRFLEYAEREAGTFYLTDFMVRHFDRIILRDLGLKNHPELMDMYFANYRKLVFLDQSGEPGLQDLARRAADALGLEYDYLYTGLQNLETPVSLFLSAAESRIYKTQFGSGKS